MLKSNSIILPSWGMVSSRQHESFQCSRGSEEAGGRRLPLGRHPAASGMSENREPREGAGSTGVEPGSLIKGVLKSVKSVFIKCCDLYELKRKMLLPVLEHLGTKMNSR